MRILVTGGTGQVGAALARRAWPHGIVLDLPTRAELDLAAPDRIAAHIEEGGYAAIINPAAYTAVDKAESDSVSAWTINALAPAALAAAAARAGIPLVHVSTDYVFDGSKAGAYLEDDGVKPLGIYGASKEGGEQAVRTGNPRSVIVRTSWVFSASGTNFVRTMLRLAASRDEVRVVDDQHGCPTSADDLAAVLAAVALRLIEDPAAPTGTYHFTNQGETTWCGFAREIFRLTAAAGLKVPQVKAIATRDYPTPARRPSNSVLSREKLARDYGLSARPFTEALGEVLDDLRRQQ
ncbi:dTDP-4-dehydrorhamnose reductase [Mesorhizobium sp. BR1-1-16]|uniref:dTDP-4-dehydrorhamnose reductase n=1 Tax=Mesorhizobium sp. BR1-1-16 TaxID=2876653 RepID=UPI001CC8EF01|nr:dTDP-4-dehydrorhamnose reductase [Mesorhizobium sp. BR1-1-16]MBZ9937681.1 dTDP-4-dehydrorhamnose reductase [Mesorhizobium sp. BR1-1-16]